MLEVGVAAIGDTGCSACPRSARAFYFYISIRRNLMKHKLWTVFLTALVALCLVVGFAACDNGMGDGADDPIVTPTPDDEESAAHEHTYAEAWISDDTYHWHASTCGHTDEVSGRGEHDYGAWEAERAAICTADGLQVRVCQTCGHEETQTLSMLGHDIVYHAGQAATCTQEGWEAYETCSRCDYTTYMAIPAARHRLVPHAGQAATCTQSGWAAYETCENCDYTTYAAISELGHDIIEHAGQAPTCTQEGWEAYEACSRCNYTTYQSIPELGHDIIEHAGQAATCTQAGWEAYETCSRCNYTTYQSISELGHDIIEHAGQAATCTRAGWEAYETCSRCDYTTYTVIPELGHDKISHPGQAATCTQAGWEAYETCSRCNYTTYKAILAQGHNYQDGICVRCKKEDPRYSHQWEEIGEDTYVCDSCGAIAKNDATQWKIQAGMFSNISSTGLTITMNTSDVINEWDAVALMSGQHNARITLPNLDSWSMDIEGMTEEEERIASTLTYANFYPLLSDFYNGGNYNSFYNTGKELSYFTTIVIEPGEEGGISYYRDGVLLIKYAYDRMNNNSYESSKTGTAGDYVKLFLMLVERTGLIVAQGGVTATNAVVYLEALEAGEIAALAEYNAKERYYPPETVNLSQKTIDNMDDYTIFIVPNKDEEILISV